MSNNRFDHTDYTASPQANGFLWIVVAVIIIGLFMSTMSSYTGTVDPVADAGERIAAGHVSFDSPANASTHHRRRKPVYREDEN